MRMDRPAQSGTVEVEIREEREIDHGWWYEVAVRRPNHAEDVYEITLSWRDHDFWCGGAIAPSRVVRAVVEYALAHETPAFPATFDAARVRRWLPRIDEELRVG